MSVSQSGASPVCPVRIFQPWPDSESVPDGWPRYYVDHADFCALERAALEVSKELERAEGPVPLGVGTSIIAMRRVLGV